MKKLFKIFNPNIEEGVRLISWATSIRWFGWGFSEAFLPIFLFSFTHTYAETGIIRSIYGIVFIISIPIVSRLADTVASKKLLMTALFLYPFIALSYFFAGAYGIVAFIVLARIINGVTYAFDSIGRSTYIRTHASDSTIATSFGFIESLANFWWIIAVLISLMFVAYIPIYWLFLCIIPTSFVAMIFVKKIPDIQNTANTEKIKMPITTQYTDFIKTIFSWNKKVKNLGILLFFVGVVTTIGEFFIPIYAYTQHVSLWKVALLTIFATLPLLLSSLLGIIADTYKYTVTVGCLLLSLFLILLAGTSVFAIQLCLVFLLGICIQVINLSIDREVTFEVGKDKIGSLSGAFQGISQLSEIIGPIILGIIIDMYGMKYLLVSLGLCSFLFTFLYFKNSKKKI